MRKMNSLLPLVVSCTVPDNEAVNAVGANEVLKGDVLISNGIRWSMSATVLFMEILLARDATYCNLAFEL